MQDFRLLVLDIDGTISGQTNEVTPAVQAAIKKARNQGLRVAIATGRMFRSAQRFHRGIGSDLPIIAYNGAWVEDPATRQVHRQLSIPPAIALEILSHLGDAPWSAELHLHVYHNDELYVNLITEKTAAYEERTGCRANLLKDLREIVHQNPTKILAVCNDATVPQRLLPEVRRRYTHNDIYCTQSTEVYVEFTCPTATKGEAVQFLTEEILGLQPENVIAIGDNFNDKEMIEYAGLGIAMGNAPAAVKASADFVTSTVEEDGVAQAIAHFFPQTSNKTIAA